VQPNPTAFASVGAAKAALGSMRGLLERYGHRLRGRTLRCPAPHHEDRHPSATLYTAFDGDERVHCHSCGFDEDVLGVARLLGEHIEIRPSPGRSRPGSRPLDPDLHRLIAHIADKLARRRNFAREWAAAKILAELDYDGIDREVLGNLASFPKLCLDAILVRDLAYVVRRAEEAK
jgi:hypothetical protein